MTENSADRLPNPFTIANSFFPDLDRDARDALAEINGNTEIVVLPNSVNMSGSNQALTMAIQMQVDTYRGAVESIAQQLGVDGEAIMARIGLNTILIKESTVGDGGVPLRGVLWHEYGHVRYGPAENGQVFSHELSALRQKYGDGVALNWCLNTRGLGYFASFCVDPGKAELEGILEELLPPEKYQEFQQKCRNAPPTISGKSELPRSAPVAVSEVIEGTLIEIRARIGRAAVGAKFLGVPDVGKTVKLAEMKWKVLEADAFEGRYRLQRLPD